MQGILENLPVGLMMIISEWPFALVAAGLPLMLLIRALWHGGLKKRRWRLAVLGGAIGGIVLGPLLAFAVIGGGFGDLRYWLDWLLLALITGAVAIYCSLLLYLVMPSR